MWPKKMGTWQTDCRALNIQKYSVISSLSRHPPHSWPGSSWGSTRIQWEKHNLLNQQKCFWSCICFLGSLTTNIVKAQPSLWSLTQASPFMKCLQNLLFLLSGSEFICLSVIGVCFKTKVIYLNYCCDYSLTFPLFLHPLEQLVVKFPPAL